MTPEPGPDPGLIDDLQQELTEFWRRGRVRARNNSALIHAKLDPSCYPLLMAVARLRSVPMSELVHRLALDKSTVTRQVDALERLGLVTRRPDPDDARARVVELTPDGRARVDAALATSASNWRDQLAKWDPEDIRSLITLMRRLDSLMDQKG